MIRNINTNQKKNGSIGDKIKFIASNWPIFLLLISIFVSLIGWVFFDISLFQPLEKIAYEQDQKRYKQRIVQRHIELGNAFLNDRHHEAAKREFKDALKLDPSNAQAHMGCFKSEIWETIKNKGFEPSVLEKRLEIIKKENPNDPHAFLFLGDIYQNIDKEKALKYYQEAMSQDSSLTAAASFGMGIVYTLKNKYKEAQEKYEQACALSKWNSGYLDNLSYQYYLNKNYDKALCYADTLSKLDPEYLPAYITISKIYRIKGRCEDAFIYQNFILSILISDTTVASLEKNKDVWFFPYIIEEDTEAVYLTDYSTKKCYLYLDMALTCILLQYMEAAQICVMKARELYEDWPRNVERFVLSDVGRIVEMRPDMLNKFGIFQFDQSIEYEYPQTKDVEDGWQVQLGAMRYYESAENLILKYQMQYSDIFNVLPMYITTDNISKDQGLFYCVRIGPFPNREAAIKICNVLKNYGIDCFKIKPK